MTRQLIITFRGVCTHFRGVVPGVPHRVVLPDASAFQFGLVDILDEDVRDFAYFLTPHLAELRTTGEADQKALSIEGSLAAGAVINGLRVQVVNATNADFDYSQYKIQSLTTFVENYVWSDDVVTGGRAALYFDLFGGIVATQRGPRGMANVQVTLETEGDPVLLITPFQPPPDCDVVCASRWITLCGQPGLPVELLVGNISRACLGIGGEKEYDYLLHYLTAKSGIPRVLKHYTPGLRHAPKLNRFELDAEMAQIAAFRIPHRLQPLPPEEPAPPMIGPDLITDVACSNSGYP